MKGKGWSRGEERPQASRVRPVSFDADDVRRGAWDIDRVVRREVRRLFPGKTPTYSELTHGIQKAWSQMPNAAPERGPKAWLWDPLAFHFSLGFKERRTSITYDTLKALVQSLAIVNGIITLRATQVASFAQPYRQTKSLGFIIRHKDTDRQMTPAELAFCKELEGFILRCGRAERNPYASEKRPDFDSFLRAYVRDTLSYDQATFEVVRDGYGVPFEFWPIDASTIRIAASDGYFNSYHRRGGFLPQDPKVGGLFDQADRMATGGRRVRYVQVINGQIEAAYGDGELAFGVRNPRTDIYTFGYGYSELEMLISIVTAHIFAEQYNSSFFSKGSMPKGALNLRGTDWTPEQLEEFKREWAALVQGVENAWRTPVFQAEAGMEWIDLNRSNREMEYGQWIEYLIKVACACFLCDPAELNFDLHGGVSQTPLFEGSAEWKLKASRDRGLKPLLRFIASQINESIIDQIDDHFCFEFVGLDELSEQEKHELLVKQLATYRTMNEVRKEMDLPGLGPAGDIPMNPTFLQALQFKSQLEQQAQQPPPGMGPPGMDGPPPDAGGEGEGEGGDGGLMALPPPDEDGDYVPSYSDLYAPEEQRQ